MVRGFLNVVSRQSVRRKRTQNGFGDFWKEFPERRESDALTPTERQLAETRDHAFIDSVAENSWPCVQHRCEYSD